MQKSYKSSPPCPPLNHGFTLIELMIVVAVVAILASIAYPSYSSYVRKSRRAEAVSALAQLQQAQERWRANNATYAANSLLTTAAPGGLGFSSATTSSGYYQLAISGNSATGYVATATAVSGTSQAGDTGCTVLTSTITNGVISSTPTACWGR